MCGTYVCLLTMSVQLLQLLCSRQNGSACVYIKANIFVAIFSGPGQFSITNVSIGADNDHIDVTSEHVSHVTS